MNDADSQDDGIDRRRKHEEHSRCNRLRHGPLAAMFYVARVTSPAVAELAREFTAASDAVRNATRSSPTNTLLDAIFNDGLSRDELKRLANEQPSAEFLLYQLQLSLEQIQQQSPADADRYRALVLTAAEHAAAAIKETRYFGWSHVTTAEQRAIDEIRQLRQGQSHVPKDDVSVAIPRHA